MSEDHRAEAYRTMEAREADMLELFERIDGDDDDDAEAAQRELDEYGLSLEWSRGRVRYVMGTGGPHDELNWEQGSRGTVADLRFVFMPWFGREEIDSVPAGLTRHAEMLAQLVDDIGTSSLPGFDELTCDDCGEPLDDDGEPQCDCGEEEPDEDDGDPLDDEDGDEDE